MKIRRILVPVVAAAAVGATVVAPSAIFGANTNKHMVGYAGGSAIKAVGSTIESDFTSESSLDTTQTGLTQANTLATATVPSVATIGTISTDVRTRDVGSSGVQLVSHARTVGVNLLDGAITAQVVDTTDTATVNGDLITGDVSTTFVGLKIAGFRLPVTIPKNFHLTIPGVAEVYLNTGVVFPGKAGSGTILTMGAGLYVSLLKARGPNPVGTEIFVNPVYSAIRTTSPINGVLLGGYAYGSKAYAQASTARVYSGPTARISMSPNGTGGVDKYNTTATVNLAPVVTIGALTDTANGVKSYTQNYSTMSTELARVNLFNGLITADALKGNAHAEVRPDGTTFTSTSTSLVNLVIAGKPISADVSPNTVITVANLGTVTIRKQAKNATNALVKVLEIKLTTAGYGLPVGALVEVGVAAAWAIPPTP